MYDIIAYIGGIFYIICYFPQIYDLWYKTTKSINPAFFFLQLIGATLMIIYAYLNRLLPIICLNGTSILCIFIILYCIYKN